RLGKDPNPTTSANQTFLESVAIGDIRAVNGRPGKGFRTYHVRALPFRVNPAPGQPIADADGSGTFHCIWQILAPDGTYVGTITDLGGTPGSDHIVVGGSGAFFGVTGVHGMMQAASGSMQRGASMSEDPAKRRMNGGGKSRATFYLYPRFRPEVEMLPSGPAVFHGADFSQVTATSPAHAGEVLVMRARGLGLIRPQLIPAGFRPFGSDPHEEVNSSVEVTIGGKGAEVINKIGWPGTLDRYRVDVRVPSGIAPGMAALLITAAWIPAEEVKIPVQ
ncbi:MAG: hypothetical protein ACKV22_08390, partial [Bryobacteraceae bacterium]